MRSNKVSKKCKTIWTVIDVLLVIPVALALGAIFLLSSRLAALPSEQTLKSEMKECGDRIQELEQRIDQRSQDIAREAEILRGEVLAASQELDQTRGEYDTTLNRHTDLTREIEEALSPEQTAAKLKDDIARLRTEYGQACRKLEDKILAGESDYRICYLTFDDGPSYLTESFLDKIDKLDIRVTFFTIGVQMNQHSNNYRNELLRREALSGHAIANHSYSHAFDGSLYWNLNNFVESVKKQEDLVYSATGIRTDVFRFPAGSYYCPFRSDAIKSLNDMGYGHIDWIGNAYDSGNTFRSSATVASNVIWQSRQDLVTVILMHDWRSETLGALETIVTTLKAENYLFLPLFKESSTVGNAVPRWDG